MVNSDALFSRTLVHSREWCAAACKSVHSEDDRKAVAENQRCEQTDSIIVVSLISCSREFDASAFQHLRS